MKHLLKPLLASLLLLAGLHSAGAMEARNGSLVIVGGALSPDNQAVHEAFLARRPAGSPAIAIIPSASGRPADSAGFFTDTLVRHGARREDIRIIHLASEDDPTTPDVDESRWAANAVSKTEIAKLADAGAIWFTGGDQLRTTRLLLAKDGTDTPMLAAIRTRLAAGAVIGGTSAGAAIMSRAMITNGDSLPALTRPVLRQGEIDTRQEGGQLVLGQGLGLLPDGLVDQHFDARARLGRLARALFTLPVNQRIGFGIDENTALLVDLARQDAAVLGASSVTILDARTASAQTGGRFAASGISLSVLGAGDRMELSSLHLVPEPGRKAILPRSSLAPPPANSGGMAVPAQHLAELLADALVRRLDVRALERMSFADDKGIIFRFARTVATAGYQGRSSDGGRRTTVGGVDLGIRPVDLAIKEIAQ